MSTSNINNACNFAFETTKSLTSSFGELIESLQQPLHRQIPGRLYKDKPEDKKLGYIFREAALFSAKVVLVGSAVYGASLIFSLGKITVMGCVASACLYELSKNKKLLNDMANKCQELWAKVNKPQPLQNETAQEVDLTSSPNKNDQGLSFGSSSQYLYSASQFTRNQTSGFEYGKEARIFNTDFSSSSSSG